MKKLIAITALLLSAIAGSNFAVAAGGELDNERDVIEQAKANLAKDLPAAVVVKVSEKDGSVAVFHSKFQINSADVAAFAKEHDGEFKAVTEKQKRGELDKDSSQSSWFFAFGYNYGYTYPYYRYPTYYYYNYSYNYAYYNCYNWGGYNYYYYGNPYARWW